MSQAEKIDPKRKVIFKKMKKMGKSIYTIEISQNDEICLIEAIDVNSPESYLIEMDTQKAGKIFKLFNWDYDKIASSMSLMNKRLVLLNPQSS